MDRTRTPTAMCVLEELKIAISDTVSAAARNISGCAFLLSAAMTKRISCSGGGTLNPASDLLLRGDSRYDTGAFTATSAAIDIGNSKPTLTAFSNTNESYFSVENVFVH